MNLATKLKLALDESRILILGAQVLFGFQFQIVFQEAFQNLPTDTQFIQGGGLLLLVLAVALLIAPSMLHQVLYQGEDRQGALRAAGAFAGASLLPITLGLGVSAFAVFERLFSRSAAVVAALVFSGLALFLFYGLGLILGDRRGFAATGEEGPTPLKNKIEQLLTEARVIIPGGQALLGFQFVVVFTKSFSELPEAAKYLHAAALAVVALSVVVLMTPAALHRIAFQGEDDPRFFQIASALVTGSALPLAVGIAADVDVVFLKISDSDWIAASAGLFSLAVLLSFWFVFPLWRRISSPLSL